MARQQRLKSESGYYHIMLRGNNKSNIFNSDADKNRFLEIIYEKKQEEPFSLHAFCLMDNHIHLMLSEGQVDLSRVMKRLAISYVYYFNKKYNRVGHLFQDRFKSEVVETDNYILSLARYIHQNPVKANMVEKAVEYKWSSYRGYLFDNNEYAHLLDTDLVLGLLSGNKYQAKEYFADYMNLPSDVSFIDIDEQESMNDEEAKVLFEKMIFDQGLDNVGSKDEQSLKLKLIINELKQRTNLSIRRIAAITGINKDKIHKFLKS